MYHHRVVTFPGRRIVAEQEVETRAKERATAAGHDITGLRALVVDGEKYNSSVPYRVDVAKKALVIAQAQPPRRGRRRQKKPRR